mmetsp:Transcript_13932/g.45785  ORF Transcript_13932/g.45785 Transcript_13932/m.45785 type:complete len:256 (-) Transcript_13932:823-1590(-)
MVVASQGELGHFADAPALVFVGAGDVREEALRGAAAHGEHPPVRRDEPARGPARAADVERPAAGGVHDVARAGHRPDVEVRPRDDAPVPERAHPAAAERVHLARSRHHQHVRRRERARLRGLAFQVETPREELLRRGLRPSRGAPVPTSPRSPGVHRPAHGDGHREGEPASGSRDGRQALHDARFEDVLHLPVPAARGVAAREHDAFVRDQDGVLAAGAHLLHAEVGHLPEAHLARAERRRLVPVPELPVLAVAP